MRPNKDGAVQLRFEGIDAPELHYVGPHRQPLGDASRDKMIEITGFVNVQYNGGLTVQSSTPEKISAYILMKGFDPHGRPISYIVTKGIGNVRSGETVS